MNDRINVGLTDDHTLYRKAISEYLAQQEGIQVVLEAKDGKQLFTRLATVAINVLLLDLHLPGDETIELITTLLEQYQKINIIVVSMCTDLLTISSLLDLGIYAYISKNDDPKSLIEAIRSAHKNKIYRNEIYTEALFFNQEKQKKRNERSVNLSPREKEIINLLWEEYTNEDIAKRVFLSIRSVEKIRQDLKEKIGYKSIAGLFRFCLRNNYISLNGSPKTAKI